MRSGLLMFFIVNIQRVIVFDGKISLVVGDGFRLVSLFTGNWNCLIIYLIVLCFIRDNEVFV